MKAKEIAIKSARSFLFGNNSDVKEQVLKYAHFMRIHKAIKKIK